MKLVIKYIKLELQLLILGMLLILISVSKVLQYLRCSMAKVVEISIITLDNGVLAKARLVMQINMENLTLIKSQRFTIAMYIT